MLLVLGLAAAAARPSAWCGRLLCGRHRQDCSHELDGRDGLDWTVSVRVSLAAQPNYRGPQGKQEEEGREGHQPEEPEGLLSVLPQLKKVDVAAPRSSSRPSRRSGSATLPNSARRAASKRRKMDLSGSYVRMIQT